MGKKLVLGLAAVFSVTTFATQETEVVCEQTETEAVCEQAETEVVCEQTETEAVCEQAEITENTVKKCEKCREREKEGDEEVVTVLTNFAGMVASFINMTQDPHNPRNIGYNLGNMIHGIGNIVTAAIRGGISIEEYVTSEDFREKIYELVLSKKTTD